MLIWKESISSKENQETKGGNKVLEINSGKVRTGASRGYEEATWLESFSCHLVVHSKLVRFMWTIGAPSSPSGISKFSGKYFSLLDELQQMLLWEVCKAKGKEKEVDTDRPELKSIHSLIHPFMHSHI